MMYAPPDKKAVNRAVLSQSPPFWAGAPHRIKTQPKVGLSNVGGLVRIGEVPCEHSSTIQHRFQYGNPHLAFPFASKTCGCDRENDLPGFRNEPEGDSLKGNQCFARPRPSVSMAAEGPPSDFPPISLGASSN